MRRLFRGRYVGLPMHKTPKSELETKTAVPSKLLIFSNEKNRKPSQQLEL